MKKKFKKYILIEKLLLQSLETQTERMDCMDQEIQTQTPFDLRDHFDKSVQTFKFMKNRRIQTPVPCLIDTHTQTIDTDLKGKLYPSVSMLKLFLNPIDPI